MSLELHLPDLPEVPISLGPASAAQTRVQMPWHLRLRDGSLAYLPLLLMALLALASWWLVKNSPRAAGAVEERPVSSEPDYTMTTFALERFDVTGRLKLRIEGARMRHFPIEDRFEIEDARIRAVAADGRVTLAHAKRALGAGDGSELQLLGGAEVTSTDTNGAPVLVQGEFLHAFLTTEQLKSHLPVLVRMGGTELHASGIDYDHVVGKMDLKGPLRAELAPRGAALAAGVSARRVAP